MTQDQFFDFERVGVCAWTADVAFDAEGGAAGSKHAGAWDPALAAPLKPVKKA